MISGAVDIGNVQYFVNLTLPNLYLFQNFLLFQFLKFGLTDFENGRFFLFRMTHLGQIDDWKKLGNHTKSRRK